MAKSAVEFNHDECGGGCEYFADGHAGRVRECIVRRAWREQRVKYCRTARVHAKKERGVGLEVLESD